MTNINIDTLRSFVCHKIASVIGIISNILLLGLFLLSDGLIYLTMDLPSCDSLSSYKPLSVTKVYTNKQTILNEYAYEPRIFTPIDKIPSIVISAFIAAEDKTFFENYGIDPLGILRALIQNINNISGGKRLVGASTITQQVVQNFLTGRKRHIDRKICEAIIAYRVSFTYSKQKILEIYLNQIFLGNLSYGIAAAAKSYFGKKLSELDPAEAALLAALPKAPSSINPYLNYERALTRRNWVLKRMYDDGSISSESLYENTGKAINLIKHTKRLSQEENTFYADEVKKQLLKLYDEKTVFSDGLIVNTNIDPELQHDGYIALRNGVRSYDRNHGWRGPIGRFDDDWKDALEKVFEKNKLAIESFDYIPAAVLSVTTNTATLGFLNETKKKKVIPLSNLIWARKNLRNQTLGPAVKKVTDVLKQGDIIVVSEDKDSYKLEQIPDVNGAIVVIENYTGRVLAMVGGIFPEAASFNRVTQALRQPGSSIKTPIYLAAVENGFSKDSILLDEPIAISQGEGMPVWRPKNLTNKFNGYVTLQEAFVRSLNIPTIQIGLALGLDKIYEVTSRLGIYPKSSDAVYGQHHSILLGAFESTLMNITKAYSIIASGGYDAMPSLISSIYDNSGNLLYRDNSISLNVGNETPKVELFRQKLIRQKNNEKIIDLLKKAVAHQGNILHRTIAGKSGTSNDSKDTWFIGMSADFTVGVFVGFDKPRTLGQKEIGATVARPIFMEFMKYALKNIPNRDIGKQRDIFEFIQIGDDVENNEDDIDEISDIEAVSSILKENNTPELDQQFGNDEDEDYGDAFRGYNSNTVKDMREMLN